MAQSIIFTALFVALLLLAIGVVLLAFSLRFEQKSGIPRGEILYEDASGGAQEQFISKRLLMAGKPDYMIKDRNGDLIPVEVKSSNAPRAGRPYESHLMQLAAYFLLLEDVLQRPVPYGLIRYRNRTLRVANTDELRARLMDVIAQMRRLMAREVARRTHNRAQRCSRCSVAHACDERLV
jgi:CRISPR-associated exonuclease Cas4